MLPGAELEPSVGHEVEESEQKKKGLYFDKPSRA